MALLALLAAACTVDDLETEGFAFRCEEGEIPCQDDDHVCVQGRCVLRSEAPGPVPGEGEGEGEGPAPDPGEGEGEPVDPIQGEGEGEAPAPGEGEGEPAAPGEGEGEPPAGEVEGEGEGEAEIIEGPAECRPPALHLTFDGAPGDIVPDSGPYGRHGTRFGGAYAEGQCGGGLELSGEDDRVTVPHHPDLDLGDEFTVGIRLRPDAWSEGFQGDGAWLVSKQRCCQSDDGWALGLRSDGGGYRFEIFGRGGGMVGEPAAPQRWQTVLVTGSASSGRLRLYVEGELRFDEPFPGAPEPNLHPLWIGALFDQPDRQVDGVIDELLILDRAATQAEAAHLLLLPDCPTCTVECPDEGVYTGRIDPEGAGFRTLVEQEAQPQTSRHRGVLTLRDRQE